nr:unnamed protein product [Haemonchus contortus]
MGCRQRRVSEQRNDFSTHLRSSFPEELGDSERLSRKPYRIPNICDTPIDDFVVTRSERGPEVDDVFIENALIFVLRDPSICSCTRQIHPLSFPSRRKRICAEQRERTNIVRRFRRETIRTGIISWCRFHQDWSFSTKNFSIARVAVKDKRGRLSSNCIRI